MELKRLSHSSLLAAPVFLMLTFSSVLQAEQSEINDSVPAPDGLVPAEAVEPTGLDIPMDGSSLEAFEQSMEQVRETGSEKEYLQLKDAFDYLLFFDIGAKNNPEVLASRLDGLTGNEILKRVKYRRK